MKTEMYTYLENRDRVVLPENEGFERWLDPDRTAVVSIDMHRGHLGTPEEGGATAPAPRARAAIPAHNAFHAACREIGIPIIVVQHWQRHGGADDVNARDGRPANWRYIYPLYWPSDPLMDEHSWEGTKWLELMIDHDPERDYYVRTKKRLSAFYPTDLEFLLRKLDVENVVITGTFTEVCDLATAFDAADRDFRVIMPRDVVRGYSEEAENAALLIVSLVLGLVVDSPALLEEWYARKERELPERFRGISDISEAIAPEERAAWATT